MIVCALDESTTRQDIMGQRNSEFVRLCSAPIHFINSLEQEYRCMHNTHVEGEPFIEYGTREGFHASQSHNNDAKEDERSFLIGGLLILYL